jgi:hypothetical protein
MSAHRRDTHNKPGEPDHLDDLRAQLPVEFRNSPDREIAQLWVAWDAARHGHPVAYLTDTLEVPPEIAEQLVSLVGHGPTDGGD